jgi:hypothetical protein
MDLFRICASEFGSFDLHRHSPDGHCALQRRRCSVIGDVSAGVYREAPRHRSPSLPGCVPATAERCVGLSAFAGAVVSRVALACTADHRAGDRPGAGHHRRGRCRPGARLRLVRAHSNGTRGRAQSTPSRSSTSSTPQTVGHCASSRPRPSAVQTKLCRLRWVFLRDIGEPTAVARTSI